MVDDNNSRSRKVSRAPPPPPSLSSMGWGKPTELPSDAVVKAEALERFAEAAGKCQKLIDKWRRHIASDRPRSWKHDSEAWIQFYWPDLKAALAVCIERKLFATDVTKRSDRLCEEWKLICRCRVQPASAAKPPQALTKAQREAAIISALQEVAAPYLERGEKVPSASDHDKEARSRLRLSHPFETFTRDEVYPIASQHFAPNRAKQGERRPTLT